MDIFANQALLAVTKIYPSEDEVYCNRVICHTYLPHVYSVIKFDGTRSMDEKVTKAALLESTAWYLYIQRQFEDAVVLGSAALRMRRESQGPDHLDTAMSMVNLAASLRRQGQLKEAEKFGGLALELLSKGRGADHLDTLASMRSLATTYEAQGRLADAEKLWIQRTESLKATFGASHLDTIDSMDSMAWVYIGQGRRGEANKVHAMVHNLRIMADKIGADHWTSLWERGNKYEASFQEEWEARIGVDGLISRARGLTMSGTADDALFRTEDKDEGLPKRKKGE